MLPLPQGAPLCQLPERDGEGPVVTFTDKACANGRSGEVSLDAFLE